MATMFDPIAAGLPAVGYQAGESSENAEHRRGTLRNVLLDPGPQESVGIGNREYDCYFISMMQALLHHSRVAQFARYHHAPRRSKEHGKEPVARHQTAFGCGFCQLYDMFVVYWTRPSTPDIRVKEVNKRFVMILRRLNAFRETISGESFDPSTQHDASEAYNEFVNWLAQSEKSVTGIDSADAAKALFKVETRQVFTCKNCGKDEPREDTELTATIDLKFDTLEGQNEYQIEQLINSSLVDTVSKKCAVCSTADKAEVDFEFTNSRKIVYFPELLCFSVVLYGFDPFTGSTTKLKHHVKIPNDIDMSKFAELVGGQVEYELYAIVQHRGTGSSISEGHYVAYVKASDGTWKLCDDEEVSQSSARAAKHFSTNRFPYMLFYARKYPADNREGVKQEDVEYKLPSWLKKKIVVPGVLEDDEAETEDPASPADEPVVPADEPSILVEKPASPAKKSASPVEEPASPAKKLKTDKTRNRGSNDGEYIPDDSDGDDGNITEEPETPKTPERPTYSPITPAPGPPSSPIIIRNPDTTPTPGPRVRLHKPTKKPSDKPYVPPREVSPTGSEVIVSPRPKTPTSSPAAKTDYSKLRVVDLKKELASRGISFVSKLRKVELIALLNKNDKAKTSPKNGGITKKATKITIIVSYTSMRVTDLKAELKRRKITFSSKLKKEELKNLLLADDVSRGKIVKEDILESIEQPDPEPEKKMTVSKKRSAEEPTEEEPRLRRSKRLRK